MLPLSDHVVDAGSVPPKRGTRIDKLHAELFEARVYASQLHESAAVATAKLDAEVVQSKRFEVQLIESARRNDDAVKQIETLAKALSNERLSVQKCQTKLELPARELAVTTQLLNQERQSRLELESKQTVEAVVKT